jgi:hypothetical protein
LPQNKTLAQREKFKVFLTKSTSKIQRKKQTRKKNAKKKKRQATLVYVPVKIVAIGSSVRCLRGV